MIWYVAVGSAIGGVSRFLLGGYVQRTTGALFPVGTLLINVSGSLLIGFILRYGGDQASISSEARALLAIGFCGGYTTFSTFSYETIALIETGAIGRATLYVVLSVVLSLLATWAGMSIARVVMGR
jgi:fluoride exporter